MGGILEFLLGVFFRLGLDKGDDDDHDDELWGSY
jgi:hypothetical protein